MKWRCVASVLLIMALLGFATLISGCNIANPPSLPAQESLSSEQQDAYGAYGNPDTFILSMDDTDRFEVWNYYSKGKSLSFLNGELYRENELKSLSAEFKFPNINPSQFRNLRTMEEVVAFLGVEPTAWGMLNENIDKDVAIYDYFDQIKVVTKKGRIVFVQILPVFAPDVKAPERKEILPPEEETKEILPPEEQTGGIGGEWVQEPANSWVVLDGRFNAKDDRAFQFIGIKAGYSDYAVEFDMNNPNDGGILIRGDYNSGQFMGKTYIIRPDWNDHYWITRDYNAFASGTDSYTKLESPKSGKVHIKVIVKGNEFKAYADGEEVVAYSDTGGKFTGEWVALYSYRPLQSFENFKIAPLEDSDEAAKHYLTESNTLSVSADEYHKTGAKNTWSYLTGEWVGISETYGFLAKADIPEIKDAAKGILHIKLSSYTNKQLNRGLCTSSKKFNIKKLTRSWDENTISYSDISSIQAGGETIASFEINPAAFRQNEYMGIEVPVNELLGEYGFTIVQADETQCRLEIISHTSGEQNAPYITIEGGQ